MIIKEIHIDGFGIFNEFSLTSLGKGVNIILGDNEAGKSTLLKFLRYTLFGYPRSLELRMPPLRGGHHGGRIRAIMSSGQEPVFERRGNDKITLYPDRQEAHNESQWLQLLGNASSDLYNNIYAFSLDELVDLASLSASGVEDRIFSLGLGLGSVSLAEIERDIQAVAGNIYTSRGRVQVIPQLLSEMNEIRGSIRRIQDNLPGYAELSHEKKKLQEQTEEAGRELDRLTREKVTLEHYLRCHDAYIAYLKADEALVLLPPLQDWPDQAAGRLDRLEEQEQIVLETIEELGQGSTVETGITALEAELDGMTVDEALLKREDAVAYLRDNLSRYRQTLDECRTEEQQLDDLQRSVGLEISGIGGLWTEEKVTDFSGHAEHRSRLERFRTERVGLERRKVELEAEMKVNRAVRGVLHVKRLAVLLAVSFVLGAAPAFWYELYPLGGALLAVALLLFFSRNRLVRDDALTSLSDRKAEVEGEERSLQEAYNAYLENELGLSAALDEERVLEVLQKIGQISKEIAVRDRLQEKIDRQRRPFIGGFERVATSFGGDAVESQTAGGVEMAVNKIVTAFNTASDLSRRKSTLQHELQRKQAALKSAGEKLLNIRGEVSSLLKTAGSTERDDFRRKVSENEQVKALLQKKSSAIETMEQITGRDRHAEVIAYLDGHDKQSVEPEIARLTGQIADMKESLRLMTTRTGELNNELSRMENGSDLAGLMTELETRRQGLREAHREWTIAGMSLSILSEVRSEYERDRQPEVIRRAAAYFEKITGGAYKRISVSLNDHALLVYDAREASKKVGQLSRGTREQLLISLRLGFIEEYEKQSEPLPVIVDEVLVNFDPLRARQTAAILQEFARDRQVLVFTCRPSTIECFENAAVIKLNV